MLIAGIDFDGTLVDTNTAKTKWIAENLGLDVPPHMCDATSCIPIIGREEYRRLGEYAYCRETTLSLPATPGALEVIRRIREIGDAVLVTARTGERLSFAEEWLALHDETRGMRAVGLDTKATSKLSRCVEEGIGVLIDDDERHLREASEMGIRAILFKQNAPTDLICDYALISRSWADVLTELVNS